MRSSLSCSALTAEGASVMRTLCALRLGECDHIADRIRTAQQHDEPIETERDAAMRGRAVVQGIQREIRTSPGPDPY